MKTARSSVALFAIAVTLTARHGLADPSETPADELRAITQIANVDMSVLPKGKIPAYPAENEIPLGVPKWSQVDSMSVTLAKDAPQPRRKKRSMAWAMMNKKRPASPPKEKIVEIAPVAPALDNVYIAMGDIDLRDAESKVRMSCGENERITGLRWETLVTSAEGGPRLDVRDLWFDGKTCALSAAPTQTVPLAAVAWDKGKPWLYAMRSEGTVTFILPHADDVVSDSMAGNPDTTRGAFTRIVVPVGRWGSATISATVPTLALNGSATASSDAEGGPFQVGIDVVQTTAEKTPTVVVRLQHTEPMVTQAPQVVLR